MRFIRRHLEKWKTKRLFKSKEFIDAYREHTDMRVARDPQAAVGGKWEEIGELQLSFLKSQGLEPQHSFLDIGCGTLRGGRHFIRYLEQGRYTGIEVSPKAVEAAHQLIKDEDLGHKQPEIILNSNGDMRFQTLDRKFDYILAQSVFTHLPEPFIVECFDNLHKILGGTFYFTIYAGKKEQVSQKEFKYPIEWFRNIVEARGYAFRDCSPDYDHPRRQVMLAASRSRQE